MERAGVVLWEVAAEHLLELEFDGNQRGHRVNFHPHLPLAFRW
jgi:hypothetical protein